jgi:hypothetical protein
MQEPELGPTLAGLGNPSKCPAPQESKTAIKASQKAVCFHTIFLLPKLEFKRVFLQELPTIHNPKMD